MDGLTLCPAFPSFMEHSLLVLEMEQSYGGWKLQAFAECGLLERRRRLGPWWQGGAAVALLD